MERDDARRERRFHPDRGTSAIDSDVASDDAAAPRARRESRNRRESRPEQSFNPNNTMDLLALKQALNAKDEANQPPKIPPKEPISPSRASMSRGSRDLAEVRDNLENDRRPRDLERPPSDERQLRVVSPPRDRSEVKPIKSILRQPREAFPEDPSPIREGVAPLKDAKKDGVPPDARWTKISRKLVNPEALEAGKERYEAREDFVIVLRVLSRDEVQGYAEVTQRIRGMSFYFRQTHDAIYPYFDRLLLTPQQQQEKKPTRSSAKNVVAPAANVIDVNEQVKSHDEDVEEKRGRMALEMMMDSVRVILLRMKMMIGSGMRLGYLRGLARVEGEVGEKIR